MAKTVQELITAAKESSTSRKTKNNDLYYDILCSLCEDDSYVAESVSKIENGEIFTEKRTLSKEFKEIIATAIKRAQEHLKRKLSNLLTSLSFQRNKLKLYLILFMKLIMLQ